MRVPRLLLLLVVLGALLPLTTTGPASADDGTPPDLVLPARYPLRGVVLSDPSAGDGVLAYTLSTPTGSVTLVRVDGKPRPLRFPRATAAVAAGRFVLLREHEQTDRYALTEGAVHYRIVDTADGSSRPVPGELPYEVPVAPLPDGGWVAWEQHGGFSVVRHAADATVTARVEIGHCYPEAVQADEQGAVITSRSDGDCSATYVDFAAGTARARRTGGASSVTLAALTTGAYAYVDGTTIVRRSRATDAVLSTRTATVAGALAITPDATAWYGADPLPYGSTDSATASVWTSPESAPARQTRAARGLGGETPSRLFVVGGGFAVIGGATPQTLGLYRVPVGASGLGDALVLAGPQAPERLEASAGRLVFTEQTKYRSAYRSTEQGVDTTPDGPRLRGSEWVVATGDNLGGHVLLSGGLTANRVDLTGATGDVVVFDSGSEVARVRTTGGAGSLSGTRVALLERRGPSGPPSVRTRVVDTADTDTPSVTVDGYGGLDGSLLAVQGEDGSVTVRDLESSAPPRVLHAADPDAPGTPGVPQAADGWVLWTREDARGTARSTAQELATGRQVVVDTVLTQAHLSGGRLAYLDVATHEVHLLELASGTDTVLGVESDVLPEDALLGLTPTMVAWVDDDGRTHVRQLDPPAGDAALLGSAVPEGFNAVHGFRPRLEASRPVPLVRLTITDDEGRLVASRDSAAPDGGLRPAWDARLGDGRTAPPGRYSWAVSAPGLDPGVNRLSGVATLDTTAPGLVLRTPVLASDASTGPAFRVSWSTPDPTAVVDVQVTRRARQPDRSIAFGALRTWKRGVPSGSAVYDAAAPYAAPPGTPLRFVVTARDPAGNVTSVVRDVLVPYDDGAAPQRFGAGWTDRVRAGSYGGRVHEASGAGRLLTVRASTNRVVLVGARCPSCGGLTVSVDGRVLRTVSTRGVTASRVRLVDLRLAGGAALHNVVVRTTDDHVVLDGLGLVA